MKDTSYIHNLFVVICLLTLSLANSQGKKQAVNTLFGKEKNIENVNPNNGYIRCVTTEYEKYLQENNPKRMTNIQFENWIATLIKQQKALKNSSQSGGIITIPVVVHVIHNGQEVGTEANITDAQVQSQITVLNQDYRKMVGTPGHNTNPIGADTQIQFALAKQDPNGNPTNGIDRVRFCQESWTSNNDVDIIVKPVTIWDPTSYFNMWTVNFSDDTLGYAQFPESSGLDGLDASGGVENTDGVVGDYRAFGSSDFGSFLLDSPYDKGRTMSHEIGHWLGLLHIWGDANCGDDFCADTPLHYDSNFGCPSKLSCSSTTVNEMVENYMDYTDDACMNIFTQNQKDRIIVIMNNAARRSSLKTSTKNFPITLFANDAEIKIENSCPIEVCGTAQNVQKITIYNRGTNNLTSATLSYTINGGSNKTYNWMGNLATNELDTFEVTINATTSGTINAKITKTNGVIDQRNTNDTASGSFILPVSPINYTVNDFVFRLQQDEYGSETTWNLKNSSGTTLYSGGPYLDKTPLPALITENWTLANNDCYTFTITDTEGDGLCCDSGNGYYDIKSSDGAILLASGATFTSSETNKFSINLDDAAVVVSDDFYLYPNPSKEFISIKTPSNSGFLNSYVIRNVVGQIIKTETFFAVNDYKIDTTSLSSGVYFIALEKGYRKKILRFIKE